VGLTKYHRGGFRVHTLEEARWVFEQVTAWQDQFRPQLGVGFVYLSDEWYLRLGEPVPPVEAYDGLDLTENGVGMVARFLSGVAELRTEISGKGSVVLVTGTLFAPVLHQMVAEVPGVEVVAVENRFFGETVTVAGLLTGRDVVDQLRGHDLGEAVLLPPAMFGGPEGQTLDEMWPEGIEEALGRRVVVPGASA
jgi:NifB/MoaA-like Fe-S oxidoreductase